MTSGFTQFSAIVGRRAALRYGAIGIGTATVALLTGCGSKSPAAATLAAFAKGTWLVSSEGKTATLTIADGSWTAAKGRTLTLASAGTWSLAGSTLNVDRAGSEGSRGMCSGTGIPESVGGPVNQTIGWSANQFNAQVPVFWDGTTLTLTGRDPNGSPMVITATRQ